MNAKTIFSAIGASFLTGCCSMASTQDIPAVRDFSVERYMGVWHEIARLPQWFERDLSKVTAAYLLDGDVVRITNRGWREGEEQVATAVGHFAGPSDVGDFRISFFRPFYGGYRIIWLSSDYDLALVTGDDRSSLWVLARQPQISAARLNEVLGYAKELGFKTDNLEYPGH